MQQYEQSTTDRYDLKSRTLSLRFRIDESHYRHQNNHRITLSCQATVAGRQRSRVTMVTVKSLTNQKLSQEQQHNGGMENNIIYIFYRACTTKQK